MNKEEFLKLVTNCPRCKWNWKSGHKILNPGGLDCDCSQITFSLIYPHLINLIVIDLNICSKIVVNFANKNNVYHISTTGLCGPYKSIFAPSAEDVVQQLFIQNDLSYLLLL